MTKIWRRFFCVFSVCLLTCFIFITPAISESDEVLTPLTVGSVQQINPYYSTQTVTYSDGTSLTRHIINGPPEPPTGFEVEMQAVALPEPNPAMGTNSLTVPTYSWVFGCSSVSGAMIAGYYDRNGYPSMYTGPANSGVAPLNNSTTYWPTWSDGYVTYPNLPLAASHNGVDGRTTKGSIDDYWIKYGSAANDPYVTGAWTQHAWGTAIGDYMKTSQSAYGNTDGSSSFWNNSSSSQLTCAAMPGMGITNDGTQGRKQFYEARGYTVTTCYNQPTDNKYAGGFSYAQFRAEIDAGRPVMLNLNGHTIVGVGYNDPSTVYIHDTWHQDGTNQSMTWGGSFSGMDLLSVSIVNLAPNTPPNAFHFTDRLAVALNTEYKSNAITVTGITKATPISIVGGRYSINGGAYTTASGTVSLGNTVKVRKMSASIYGTWKNATLTIGEASDIFSVMTHYEGSADPFTFTNITNAALNTEYTSNVVYLTGFYIPTTLSGTPASVVIVPPPAPHMCHVRYFGVFCADGECEYSRPDNGNDYWTNVYMTNFTCWQGTWVKVRMMSPGTYSTTKTMVLQAGDDQSGTFSVTTMAPP